RTGIPQLEKGKANQRRVGASLGSRCQRSCGSLWADVRGRLGDRSESGRTRASVMVAVRSYRARRRVERRNGSSSAPGERRIARVREEARAGRRRRGLGRSKLGTEKRLTYEPAKRTCTEDDATL